MYKICAHGDEDTAYKCYERVKAHVRAFLIGTSVPRIVAAADVEGHLVRAYVSEWRLFSASADHIAKLFRYGDRTIHSKVGGMFQVPVHSNNARLVLRKDRDKDMTPLERELAAAYLENRYTHPEPLEETDACPFFLVVRLNIGQLP